MRRSGTWTASRRNLLKGVGMATAGVSLPVGAALAQGAPAAKGPKLLEMDGKAKLVVLGDKPLVAETPNELLDDDVTPTDKLFIRNNGLVPEIAGDPKAWKIKVDGEVNTPLEIALGDLMSRFPNVTYQLMLECGGNGRSFFNPEARGNQWTNGGAGCPQWTGVRLAGVGLDQVAVAHLGARQGTRRSRHGRLLLPRAEEADRARQQGRREGHGDPGIHAGAFGHHLPGRRHATGRRHQEARPARPCVGRRLRHQDRRYLDRLRRHVAERQGQ